MQVVERDFAKGKMTGKLSDADKKRIKGHLPFYSVGSMIEADWLVMYALESGEFARDQAGNLIEMTLYSEQTPAKLGEAGDRLKALHDEFVVPAGKCDCEKEPATC